VPSEPGAAPALRPPVLPVRVRRFGGAGAAEQGRLPERRLAGPRFPQPGPVRPLVLEAV